LVSDKLYEKVNNHDQNIVIVIPALNEEKGIGLVVDGIKKSMNNYNNKILVVDGHSQDQTVEISKKSGASVIFQQSIGYGDALMSGFNYAIDNEDADILVMIDADGTYDPSDIPALLNPIFEKSADLVIGNRLLKINKGSMSFINRLGNSILSWIVKRYLKINVNDTQCGLRALRANLIKNINIKSNGMPFATEMLVEAKQVGAGILEVPIKYYPRIGTSKLNPLKDGILIFAKILKLIYKY